MTIQEIEKNKITIYELITEWLKYKKDNIAIKTYSDYKRNCANICECIGYIKLQDITVKMIEDFYHKLKTYEGKGKNKTGYSEKTVKHHYTLVSEILNTAIKWGYLYNNPNCQVTPIKVHKKEIECYSPEEVKQLINILQNEPIKHQAIIMLALDSGCRRGELTGLTWNDVNFEKSTITINKATQYVSGYGTFEKSTKTESSNRTVYIAPSTLRILKQYRAEQAKNKMVLGDKWQGFERVFTTDKGSDIHPNRPYKILKQIINKYGLKDISFHALRHTSISLQIISGVQTQIISKRAGHSSISITH